MQLPGVQLPSGRERVRKLVRVFSGQPELELGWAEGVTVSQGELKICDKRKHHCCPLKEQMLLISRRG